MSRRTIREARRRTAELWRLAHVASGMVDGDVALRILSDRSLFYLAHPHPRHVHLAGDYYDVDPEAFVLTKKTLLRLERLVDFPCNATLWVRVKGTRNLVTAAVQNGRLHRYYRFGENARPPPPDMKQCLKTGRAVLVPADPSAVFITVLAPVRDSLDRVVGCVELTTAHPASRTPAPAWS